jgi:sortase A
MAIRLNLTAPDNEWGPLPPHAHAPARPARVRIWLERALLLIGALCICYYAYVQAEAYLYQQFETRELDAILASAPPPSVTPRETPRPVRAAPAPGSAIGRIAIPRLGVSAVIRAGSDAKTLRLAVGYIPGTALPGEPGNVGLAGHRDTFFRRLRDIRPDDEIRVTTADGVFSYRVEHTLVVNPKDVWVLGPTAQPALTLVTCFPFTYVGSAPQRFIVRATSL